MNINIIYSLKFEKERINYTKENTNFYKQNGYTFYLPINLEKEFNINVFKNIEKKLLSEIDSKNIFKKLIKYFNYDFENINLYLTKYGTLGSYEPENKIIININTKRNFSQIFIHELIHLFIHNEIEKNNISHFYKEALVDNIFLYIFPEIGFRQNISENIFLEVKNFFKKENFNYKKTIEKLKDR